MSKLVGRRIGEPPELVEARKEYYQAQEAFQRAVEVSLPDQRLHRSLRIAEALVEHGPEVLGVSNKETCELGSSELKKEYGSAQLMNVQEMMKNQSYSSFQDTVQFWEFLSGDTIRNAEEFERSVKAAVDRADVLQSEQEEVKRMEWNRRCELTSLLVAQANELTELLNEYAVGVHHESTNEEIKWLQEMARTVAAKLRALKAQVLADTYNQDAVSALRKARAEVEASLREAHSKLEAAQLRSRQYDNLSNTDFKDIAEEYEQVLDRIKHLTWSKTNLH
ncbi:hypothetical protein NDN08_003563 [Rhodosorus marinus]|uniref:Uncharacterized protein n=1 Tax=Rhodosorus marinus TaxID=101924 RepID=A0AAV8UZR0_9RHOD|nr:hypothetical protein NDN08_003563 [Rhodosorus marinus]